MTTFYAVGSGGKMPSFNVSIDFTNAPTSSTRTWTDVTPDVRSLNYTLSGRNDALATTSTGTLAMTLSNKTGNYDPTNASGAYYPNVDRLRWIRVQAQWAGVTYNRWTGLIDSWTISWPEAGKDNICSVTASDVMMMLNNFDLGGNDFPRELTGSRVSAVLALAPASVHSTVSAGESYCIDTGVISAGMKALGHLQQVEDTENGRLFADAGGTIHFQDRYWRIRNSTVSQGTIGDGVGEIPYLPTTTMAYDDVNIWNQATITPSMDPNDPNPPGPATAVNSTSQTANFQRTITKTLLTDNYWDCLGAAGWLVSIYGDPAPKMPALDLSPTAKDPAPLWATVLALNNSDRCTFKRRPSYGGTISTSHYVEQVQETMSPGGPWSTIVQLLPVSDYPSPNLWILGDSTCSKIGNTTYVCY